MLNPAPQLLKPGDSKVFHMQSSLGSRDLIMSLYSWSAEWRGGPLGMHRPCLSPALPYSSSFAHHVCRIKLHAGLRGRYDPPRGITELGGGGSARCPLLRSSGVKGLTKGEEDSPSFLSCFCIGSYPRHANYAAS